MSAIQVESRPVYLAPTKGRRYLTAKAAAVAEARSMLNRKYPREEADYEQGRMISPGWHWSEDQQHVTAHKRLARMFLKRLRSDMKAGTT